MADNLARIRETIGCAPVKLIAVTKNVEPEKVEEAFRFGVTEFGENRVQEALDKQQRVSRVVADQINWHFIGHLQSNKAKQVVGRFALIHSIDSLNLACEVSKAALKLGVIQPVLLQVKLVEDPSKSGFSRDQLRQSLAAILAMPGIKVQGLMTITPLTADEDIRQTCFAGLSELSHELERSHAVELKELSMGMSNDFVQAIACGATMVRLGRAVFGS